EVDADQAVAEHDPRAGRLAGRHGGERLVERAPGASVVDLGALVRPLRAVRDLCRLAVAVELAPPDDGAAAVANLAGESLGGDHATRACERAHAMVRLLIHPRVLADGTAAGSRFHDHGGKPPWRSAYLCAAQPGL